MIASAMSLVRPGSRRRVLGVRESTADCQPMDTQLPVVAAPPAQERAQATSYSLIGW